LEPGTRFLDLLVPPNPRSASPLQLLLPATVICEGVTRNLLYTDASGAVRCTDGAEMPPEELHRALREGRPRFLDADRLFSEGHGERSAFGGGGSDDAAVYPPPRFRSGSSAQEVYALHKSPAAGTSYSAAGARSTDTLLMRQAQWRKAVEHLDMNAERFLIQQHVDCSASQVCAGPPRKTNASCWFRDAQR
jgi:hypothetical protein